MFPFPTRFQMIKIETDIAWVGEVTDNPRVVVGLSSNLGRGLFATADLPKGEVIAIFDAQIYTAEKSSLLPKDLPLNVHDHAVQFSETQYRWSRYGTVPNHSCDPNCGINGNGRSFRIVAMRNIRKGEQLTFDYEMTEDSDWIMVECRCGSPICRKKIGAHRNMPVEIRKKYKGYIASYLIQKYGEPK